MEDNMKKFIVFLMTTMMLSVMTGCGFKGCGVNMNATLDTTHSQESKSEVSNTKESTIHMTGETTAKITKEEAEQIALKHANLTAEEVSYLRSEYEMDDGIPQYDVHFRHGAVEYEYEIHAETGNILSFEQD